MRTCPSIGPALAIILVAAAASLPAQTDIALRDELLMLRESDQSGRGLIEEATRQHGIDSPEVNALWDEQSRLDAINLRRLREIVSEHGWPGQTMVGREGAIAAFLILQHADHATQLEYFPLVQAAFEAGELAGGTFALLQDRILVREGKPQIFGTQLFINEDTGKCELYPIEDEENVDTRRADRGMIPLAEYVNSVRGNN